MFTTLHLIRFAAFVLVLFASLLIVCNDNAVVAHVQATCANRCCGRAMPLWSEVDQRCPSCRVTWSPPQTHYGRFYNVLH